VNIRIRYFNLACVVTSVVMMAAACGGKTPTGPGTGPPTDPGPPVTNTPPVIGKFTIQGSKANEPPNFADVSEEVPVSVEVTDAESQIDTLKFNWSAGAGTFSGTGRSVIWKAPATIQAPTELMINLEVVETYTSQGKSIDNKVTGSAPLSLHDSITEVGEMSRQFLLDFSDSTITDIPFIMRNFQPDCYGTAEETRQVTDNRQNFRIIEWRVDPATTVISFGGLFPFPLRPPQRGDARALVRTFWRSRVLRTFEDLTAGQETTANGIDHVAAFYYRDQKRWRLCDSQYEASDPVSLRAIRIRGMVP
jgi:hypothetical protein